MALMDAGIAYEWQGTTLGGLRRGGYAAHMETALFADAAAALIAAWQSEALCIMCAETKPSDCHRSHIAD
jgi:hypothetical protein